MEDGVLYPTMHRRTWPLHILLCAALVCSPARGAEGDAPAEAAGDAAPAVAPDISRELLQRLPADEIRWLEADGGRFPVLLRAQTLGESRGGVILLHGYHHHLDWPVVISPLRKLLSEGGWWTVSVPVPKAPPGRELAPVAVDPRRPPSAAGQSAGAPAEGAPAEPAADEGGTTDAGADGKADYRGIVAARIQAAIALLNGEGQFNVALVGHGSGGNWALDFFSGQPRDTVAGLVLIDVANAVAGLDNAGWYLDMLAKEKQRPVLDLAGTEATLQQAARDRQGRARREGLAGYRFMARSAPPSGGPELDPDLHRVRAWLEKSVRRELVRGRAAK